MPPCLHAAVGAHLLACPCTCQYASKRLSHQGRFLVSGCWAVLGELVAAANTWQVTTEPVALPKLGDHNMPIVAIFLCPVLLIHGPQCFCLSILHLASLFLRDSFPTCQKGCEVMSCLGSRMPPKPVSGWLHGGSMPLNFTVVP